MKEYPYSALYLEENKSKIATRLFIIFVYILLVFYAIVFSINIAFNTAYRYIIVEGSSMQPTLNPDPILTSDGEFQDSVYIRLTQDVDYNDIIIVDRSGDGENAGDYTVIKRALAFEGDKISIVKLPVGDNGEYEYRFLRIKNGDNISTIVYQGQDDEYIIYEDYIIGYEKWSENYPISLNNVDYEGIFYGAFIEEKETETHNVVVNGQVFPVEFFTVGSNKAENEPEQIFFMGDNRINSLDSRWYGTMDIDKVIGKVITVVHNGYSIFNSAFSWIEKVWDYFVIIWNEIIEYFSVL